METAVEIIVATGVENGLGWRSCGFVMLFTDSCRCACPFYNKKLHLHSSRIMLSLMLLFLDELIRQVLTQKLKNSWTNSLSYFMRRKKVSLMEES